MLNIKTFTVNPLQMNCYVVYDETLQAVIIDAGMFYEEECKTLATFIEEEKLKPVAYLLTHAHFDHCCASRFIEETYGLLPRMHNSDDDLYKNLPHQFAVFLRMEFKGTMPPAGRYIDSTSTISFGQHAFTVFETPGHTLGGVCFYCEEEKVLFTGDSLFCGSIGRTDLPDGSYDKLIANVKSMLATLPQEVRVFPGHGSSTTVQDERAHNPYII